MKNITLGYKVVDQLWKFIKEQGYGPGDKIPNEYELASHLGVSRNTIREAVRALASRNILDIYQGAGTFISKKMGVSDDPLGFSLVEDRRKLVKELMEIRIMIEPHICSLAAQNATEQEIKRLGELCEVIEELYGRQQNFLKEDIEFHIQLASCSHNSVISNLIPIIIEGITVYSNEVLELNYDQSVKSHREIFNAVCGRQAIEAHQAMLYHLLYNRNRFMDAE